MKSVSKYLPAGATMEPNDLVGVFKEAGFHLLSETCPIQIAPPWLVYRHKDGGNTWVQFQGDELNGNPMVCCAAGRFE